jgi:transposase-like protein
MSLSMEHDCPVCGGSREFWLTARTNLHLGEKRKWRCSECDYSLVIVADIDTSADDLAADA